jgi:hypothetical protein
MKHLPLRECGYAIGVILIACALYGSTYVALSERKIAWYNLDPFEEVPVVSYRFGDEWAEWFFAFAHEIDSKIRSDMWRHQVDPRDYRQLDLLWIDVGGSYPR